MNWLAESPWPAITVGVVLELGLAIALVRTGRGVLLAAIGLVLLATIGMVALERVMVTETEEVEDALADVEAALEANDAERVLALFSASSRRRAEVESALARFRVRDARIGRDLELVINQLTNPPSARAYFTGRLDAEDTRREVPYETLILKFRVTLSREGERWLIDDYAVQDQFSQNWTRGRVEDR
jgi:hypothetical protein